MLMDTTLTVNKFFILISHHVMLAIHKYDAASLNTRSNLKGIPMNQLILNNVYQQDTEFELIKQLIPYLQNRSFIDIGAEKGSFTKFLSSLGLTGCFFEPLPKFEAELKILAKHTHCTF